LNDSKYPAGNYFYPIQGTSMASPQVCGLAACLATAKDRFNNTDLRKYLNDNSIDGDMTFDIAGGALNDNSCRQGSPNRYLHVVNPRKIVGYLTETKGERTTGQTYPRSSIFNAPAPENTQTTYTFTVTNGGSSVYLFTGSDEQSTFSNAANPTIRITSGDILEISLNASGHPMYFKTSMTTGTGPLVTEGTVTGQGTSVGTITWNTLGVTPGTYYYACQFHGSMAGSIVIS
jgi:plastocyanin